jgi:hypothetical protein
MYDLNIINTNSTVTKADGVYEGDCSFYIKCKIYAYHADASRILLGTSTVQTEDGGPSSYNELDVTWAVSPAKSILVTDRVQVEVYGEIDVNPPTILLATLITEVLGVTQLDAVTWTFHLWVHVIRIPGNVDYVYYFSFLFGSTTRNSRITNFTYSTPAAIKGVSGNIIPLMQIMDMI